MPADQSCTVACGGRQIGFHVGNAAREIGGLGEALILSGRIGALAQQEGFSEAVYAALCNTTWSSRHCERWGCSWRCAGDIAAAIRGLFGDDYLTFYCGGGEGRVSDEIRGEFLTLGWEEVTDAG